MKIETEICDICKDRIAITGCKLCDNKICTNCGRSVSITNSTSSSYLFMVSIENLPKTKDFEMLEGSTKGRMVLCINCIDILKTLTEKISKIENRNILNAELLTFLMNRMSEINIADSI